MNDSAGAPVSAPVSAKVSVCILSYMRPRLLRQMILPALERYALVDALADKIIISHGFAERAFDYESDRCRIVHRRDLRLGAVI